MPRTLVLLSALTVLTTSCFHSPAVGEADDGGGNLCQAAGGYCGIGPGCPGPAPTQAETDACAPSGPPTPAGYACCLPCPEGEAPNAGLTQGCHAVSTSTTSSGASSSGASGSGGSTGGSSGQCEIPAPGSCSSDDDCVLAICGNSGCNCGSSVIARSQLDESACLIEQGAPIPAACTPQGMECDCPAHAICTPQCRSGTCACELCDPGETVCNGACTDPSSDSHNCGGCGNECASGQLCLDGVCSPGTSAGGSDDGGCSETNFCACTNFCISTCRCGDGGCPPTLTQVCEGAVCPNSCPSGEACAANAGGVFLCSPLCTPGGTDGQGSCQDGMTCQTACT